MTNLVEINGHCNESPLALTPVSEQGIRALFEGLAAVHDTLVFSAPAKAAIAITPSLFSLLVQYCGGLWCKLRVNRRKAAYSPNGFMQPRQLPRFRTEFAPELPDLVSRTGLCECDV